MHDPLILLLHVKLINLDVWHREPNGHDAGEICHDVFCSTDTVKANLSLSIRHWRHLYLRWWPYLNIKMWIFDRCDGCGYRFHWKQARHSYMSSDKVWHNACMSLRSVRSSLNDLTKLMLQIEDRDAHWRANRRLEHLRAKQQTVAANTNDSIGFS